MTLPPVHALVVYPNQHIPPQITEKHKINVWPTFAISLLLLLLLSLLWLSCIHHCHKTNLTNRVCGARADIRSNYR